MTTKKQPKSRSSLAERIALGAATQRILTPLVKALRQNGVSLREITDMLHEAISVSSKSYGNCLSYEFATRLISRWMLDSRFCDASGPRDLTVDGENSFATLSALVETDSPRMLHELRRVGVVALKNGRVRLISRGYVPEKGRLEKLDILGRDGAEFVKAMIHNIDSGAGKSFLQRRASYDNIGSRAVPSLQSDLCAMGQGAIESVNRKLAAADRDRNPKAPGGKRTRVSFGVYFFQEPIEAGGRVRTRSRKRPTR